MDIKAFETELERDGYRQIEMKSFPPGHRPGHAHDFDVRGLVLDGEITLDDGEGRQTYRTGEMFAMPAHIAHTEDVGPKGVRFIYGRRG
jgi:quercetin dioxygenase-like cupin family protein